MEPLLSRIISEDNIYNAIYALESYVFERNLLNPADTALYKQLEDKYDKQKIQDTISKCQDRLRKLYSKDELFKVSVRYKLKKVEDDEKFSFRPIHTASLIDQICMVCMLQPLMFEDSTERKPSELTKLIPHNFYGNIPSLNPEKIFVRWQLKYKEYSDVVLEHCKEYKENKKYKYEVCLDLKDFFPSINPVFIFNYIYSKLQLVYADSLDTLKQTLTKLLYFYIDESTSGWFKQYYKINQSNVDDIKHYMTRGIAQGLPQSYYFGNIFMITAAEVIAKHFKGDAYYYVDDSVIFTNNVNETSFVDQIESLNEELKKKQDDIIAKIDVKSYLSQEDWCFQNAMQYNVEFHKNDKSYYIAMTDAFDGAEVCLLNPQISLFASLSNNLSELDDSISLNKISEIISLINNELHKHSDDGKIQNDKAKQKMLRRNRRFFLFRQKQLHLKQIGEVADSYLSDFYNRFMIKSDNRKLKDLSEIFDEEIFQTECRMLINLLDEKRLEEFISNIVVFEQQLLSEGDPKFLYYQEDLNGCFRFLYSKSVRYDTLSDIYRRRYHLVAQSNRDTKQNCADNFMLKYEQNINDFIPDSYLVLIKHANEFNRCILNAFFSSIYNIDISDEHHFVKLNNRKLTYTEFRTIAYLRNTHFEFDTFKQDFMRKIASPEEKIYGGMHIDMSLMDVLNPLIMYVKNPTYVDNLILTHRIVSGLWKNGSKFLNSYTLHNEEHAISLILQCIHITRVIDYLNLKKSDYYVLFLACYLHDISMVIPPDLETFITDKTHGNEIVTSNIQKIKNAFKENKIDDFTRAFLDIFRDVDAYFEQRIRNTHPKDSATFIRDHANSFLKYITPSILDVVANVSESHGFDANEVYKRASKAKSELFSLKYMMILLRLADLMDMSNDRINYFRLKENLNSMSEVSQFHWISHLITEGAEISAQYLYDKEKTLLDEPISETIQVRIYLNVAYKATIEKKYPCKGCLAAPIQKCEENNNEVICVKILGETSSSKGSCYKRCPIICSWMMNKNDNLVNELQELQRYLNSIRSRLFNTKFEIHYVFNDKYKLDNELFDIVYHYLEECQ